MKNSFSRQRFAVRGVPQGISRHAIRIRNASGEAVGKIVCQA
jgi:hypothetical protein